MERPAGRAEAGGQSRGRREGPRPAERAEASGQSRGRRPVKMHDKRAHSRDTVASVLGERMRAHVETVRIDENHNKLTLNLKQHL